MGLDQENRDILREASFAEAIAVIGSKGIHGLSLQGLSERLEVPLQEIFLIFETRQNLLAEVVTRCFNEFTQALLRPQRTGDPATDALAMGMAYVAFATAEPTKYHVIFGGQLPDPHDYPEMTQAARESFNTVRESVARLFEARAEIPDRDLIDREALVAWSSLHGVVGLINNDAVKTLDLPPSARTAFLGYALQKNGLTLGIDVYRGAVGNVAQ